MNIKPSNWFNRLIVHGLARLTPRCQEITRLVSKAQDRPLSWRERLLLRLHLVICIWCERYQGQTEFLRQTLRNSGESFAPPDPPRLSEEARQRLREQLKK